MEGGCLSLLKNEILCRDNIMRNLYSLIGRADEPLPESLFLYGHVATGKSLIISKMLEHIMPNNHSIINCIEHPNGRHIYEYILLDLASGKLSSSDSYKVNNKCDNFLGFVSQLKSFALEDARPIFIVFDKCDRMRDMDANILPSFLRLRELSGVNVCTIFISDIVWEKYHVKMGMLEPIKIHFPQYTRDELAQILYLYKPDNYYGEAFYKNYLNLFLSVFFRFCRDLNELRYMARINFSKYIEPIETGICNENDIGALWRNISNVLKTNLEVIYLRVSSDDFVQRTQLSREIESTTRLALSFELPYYAKFLLIAAYLASYNPAKEDKRLFVKQSGKTKKRKTASKKAQVMNTHSGPKNFPLDRMLAIFCAIVDENVDLNANLLAQIPTMCQLGLLANVGDSNLDEPKFKCCVSYDFVTVISKTVSFTIKNYLYDFIH